MVTATPPHELTKLPLRAQLAYAARCVRRVQPLFSPDPGHPDAAGYRSAIEAALRLAEEFAAGGDVPPEWIAQAEEAALAAVLAASGESDDSGTAGVSGGDPVSAYVANAAYAVITATRAASECQSAAEPDAAAVTVVDAASIAADAALAANPAIEPAVRFDFDMLCRLRLGRFPELGEPVDPSESAILGSLFCGEAPPGGVAPRQAGAAASPGSEEAPLGSPHSTVQLRDYSDEFPYPPSPQSLKKSRAEEPAPAAAAPKTVAAARPPRGSRRKVRRIVAQLRERKARLREESDRLRRKQRSLRAARAKLAGERAVFEAQRTEEIQQAQTELESERQRLEAALAELESLRAAATRAEEEGRSARSEIQRLTQDCTALRAQHDQLCTEQQAWQNERDEWAGEKETLLTELARVRAALAEQLDAASPAGSPDTGDMEPGRPAGPPPFRMLMETGSASAMQIAEVLHELSGLNRQLGGPGVRFEVTDCRVWRQPPDPSSPPGTPELKRYLVELHGFRCAPPGAAAAAGEPLEWEHFKSSLLSPLRLEAGITERFTRAEAALRNHPARQVAEEGAQRAFTAFAAHRADGRPSTAALPVDSLHQQLQRIATLLRQLEEERSFVVELAAVREPDGEPDPATVRDGEPPAERRSRPTRLIKTAAVAALLGLLAILRAVL